MLIPPWLTWMVAAVVLFFGAYRIKLAFRTPAEQERAERRRGLYGGGRRSQFLIGSIYLLLGAALVATSLGWNPTAGLWQSATPTKPAPTKGTGVIPVH